MAVKTKDKADKTSELLKQLEEGVSDLFTSGKYENYLKVMSKFHNYSFTNSVAIWLQNPEATNVAGFKSWQNNFNRNVKKGEKAITIIAPAFFKKDVETKDAQGNATTEEVMIPRFKAAYVFDVAQTEGEPLPEIVTKLTGDVIDFNSKLECLKKAAPCPVRVAEIMQNGYFAPKSNEIVIKNTLSEEQTLKTLIHEMAHATLHHTKSNHETEVIAESVAFVVSNNYGIDSSGYSFGYVAGWSKGKDIKQLKENLDVIQKTANELIEKIDKAFERSKEKIVETSKSKSKAMVR